MIWLRLIRESWLFAWNALRVNMMRTVLSLLGITIGIFSVIGVLTMVDSLEGKLRSSIDSLGNDVVFIQKWPWGFGGEYPWWKYYQRPQVNVNDGEMLGKLSQTAKSVVFMASTSVTIEYEKQRMQNVGLVASSHEYKDVIPFEIDQGRYFSVMETNAGKNVCIIGSDLADRLFKNGDPVQKTIKAFGRKLLVVGVFKREGEDMFGQSSDRRLLIPINFARNVFDVRRGGMDPVIMVKPKKGVTVDEMKDELIGLLRSIRRLKPSADDNFSINVITTLRNNFDAMFSSLSKIGWIIGGLSLLVGGFGIANIMFVSVRERTKIIGIQKALGAKNFFILTQFLFEAVFLSIIGGAFGLLIVFGLVLIVNAASEFEIALSMSNILRGLSVSFIIGLVAGVIPAVVASRLSPVDAIRTN